MAQFTVIVSVIAILAIGLGALGVVIASVRSALTYARRHRRGVDDGLSDPR